MKLLLIGYHRGQPVHKQEVPVSALGSAIHTTVGHPDTGLVIDRLSVFLVDDSEPEGRRVRQDVAATRNGVGPANPAFATIEEENKAGLEALEADRQKRVEALGETTVERANA